MDSSEPGGKTSANGVCDLAGRVPGRLVVDGTAARGDHPMLQVSEVKKTHYPYKEPRIDQRMYQAEIPALQGGDSNRAVTRGSSSPRAGKMKYPRFICVCRLKTRCVLQNKTRERRGDPARQGLRACVQYKGGVCVGVS